MSNVIATGLAPVDVKLKDKHSPSKLNTLISAIKAGQALTSKQQALFKKLKKQLGLDNYNVSKDGILSKQ